MPLYLGNKQNVLFIHIPKTGGTTVENWLYSTGEFKQILFSEHILEDTLVTGQHFGYESLKQLIGDIDNSDLLRFAIVRNPFERIISEFFYRDKIGDLKLGGSPEKYFSAWVSDILKSYLEKKSILDNHLRPQSYFVSQDVKVFKFEDGIEDAIFSIANNLGIDVEERIERKKVGTKRSVYWSKEAINLVCTIYHDDFTSFGYQPSPINNTPTLSNINSYLIKLEYFFIKLKRKILRKLRK